MNRLLRHTPWVLSRRKWMIGSRERRHCSSVVARGQSSAVGTVPRAARHSYYIHGNGWPPNGGSCQVVASLTYRYPTHRIV